MRTALEAGVAGRRRVPGKHGAAAVEFAVVVAVSVADRPGELGRLFADAGTTGVNLEDVRIEHAQGRPTGLVELEIVARLGRERWPTGCGPPAGTCGPDLRPTPLAHHTSSRRLCRHSRRPGGRGPSDGPNVDTAIRRPGDGWVERHARTCL